LIVPPFCHASYKNDIELQLVFMHVFVEKSFQPPEEMQSYIEEVSHTTAKEQEVIVSVGYMFHLHDAVIRMRGIIAEHDRPLMIIDMPYNCWLYSFLHL